MHAVNATGMSELMQPFPLKQHLTDIAMRLTTRQGGHSKMSIRQNLQHALNMIMIAIHV